MTCSTCGAGLAFNRWGNLECPIHGRRHLGAKVAFGGSTLTNEAKEARKAVDWSRNGLWVEGQWSKIADSSRPAGYRYRPTGHRGMAAYLLNESSLNQIGPSRDCWTLAEAEKPARDEAGELNLQELCPWLFESPRGRPLSPGPLTYIGGVSGFLRGYKFDPHDLESWYGVWQPPPENGKWPCKSDLDEWLADWRAELKREEWPSQNYCGAKYRDDPPRPFVTWRTSKLRKELRYMNRAFGFMPSLSGPEDGRRIAEIIEELGHRKNNPRFRKRSKWPESTIDFVRHKKNPRGRSEQPEPVFDFGVRKITHTAPGHVSQFYLFPGRAIGFPPSHTGIFSFSWARKFGNARLMSVLMGFLDGRGSSQPEFYQSEMNLENLPSESGLESSREYKSYLVEPGWGYSIEERSEGTIRLSEEEKFLYFACLRQEWELDVLVGAPWAVWQDWLDHLGVPQKNFADTRKKSEVNAPKAFKTDAYNYLMAVEGWQPSDVVARMLIDSGIDQSEIPSLEALQKRAERVKQYAAEFNPAVLPPLRGEDLPESAQPATWCRLGPWWHVPPLRNQPEAWFDLENPDDQERLYTWEDGRRVLRERWRKGRGFYFGPNLNGAK